MTEGEALAGAIGNAVAAEQAGLDSVWFAEHHFISCGGPWIDLEVNRAPAGRRGGSAPSPWR